MDEFMTTEQAIEYLETFWKMNQLNIDLATMSGAEIEQEELWAHEAIKLVLLQAKSNNFLEMCFKDIDKGESTDTQNLG